MFQTVHLDFHLAPAPFFHPENAPKSLAAGALPQTPLGELIYGAPQTP